VVDVVAAGGTRAPRRELAGTDSAENTADAIVEETILRG
jgi:hypothetical protein